MHRLNPAILI